MARDETARERGSEDSLLDRRSYLKLAGAAAASVAAAGASSRSVGAASYDTIEVSAGETKVINVDAGETFENKLIDITADGAHVKLMTNGSGWTVRNVGVKGQNDSKSNTYATFYLRCTDEGEALAENIYMGDGAVDRCGHAAVSDWANAGTVTIRNIHVAGWSADGMYMSHAGNTVKQTMGVTQIENAYLKNNNIENCRLGTPGSYIKDSVIHVESQDAVTSNESGQVNARGLWFKEQSGLKAVNCDISVTGSHAVFASDGGSGTLENCRVEGPVTGSVEQVNVSGSPDVSAPDSVPMSAEEAASGQIDSSSNTSSSTDTTSSTKDDGQQSGDGQGTLLELVPDDSAASVTYEFTVEGSVRKRTSGTGHTAEGGDSVTDNGDGTVTVSGVAGNGYGDAFFVDGAITSMNLDESVWTLKHGGSEVGVDDLTLPNKLVIDGGNRPRSSADYTFEVSGAVRKDTALGSVQQSDSVSDGTITGAVFGGKDGYRFSGEITGFSLDGPANVRVEDGS
ncbi:right-handed parallel beta-helix repeat-containing protein [Halorussus sp. MSC15.2]|uniref:right-handed parallel beta-helix repeat-containing protein n=1 Tax=Halorussus sp. MSC15.2 TaxID=2283638 RepID=UPI0013D8DABD|nr:right-handed parallel beta-helix repeat-containing protein [Halorussus sp. MSC15.2]NEU56515.1 right-handed parallel beta-helix repeat-containing protein [Halorussus sp. MSC15.2]